MNSFVPQNLVTTFHTYVIGQIPETSFMRLVTEYRQNMTGGVQCPHNSCHLCCLEITNGVISFPLDVFASQMQNICIRKIQIEQNV